MNRATRIPLRWGVLIITFTTLLLLVGWALSLPARAISAHAASPYPFQTVTQTQVIDVTFTNAWDTEYPLQRASLALPDPLPATPVPVILYVHGSIWCSDKAPHHSAATRESLGQVVARHGWIFAAAELHGERPLDDLAWCPNISVGYRPYGARPAQWDVYYLWEYVRTHYNVDSRRVYLVAHSAGGLTALPLLARFPDLFAGAVVYWSPTDLARWYEENMQAREYDRARNIRTEVGGTPDDVPYNYARRSPLTFASNLTHVPLALVHGREDTKVAFHHSEDLYTAIRNLDANAPVYLYPFEGGHGDDSTYPMTWTVSWLAQYTRPAPPSTLNLTVDAGGEVGVPGEPELGPFDHFWWLGWTPWAGERRWTRVHMTHTVGTYTITGVISDSVGITLTLHTSVLGWDNATIQGTIHPPAPTPVYTFTANATTAVHLPVPPGRVSLEIHAALSSTLTPTPTPTPTVGSIYGQVFADENGNGLKDENERGIANATVILRQSNFTPITTVVTTETGQFRFANLSPGSYIVQETNPRYYADTTVNTRLVHVQAGQETEVLFGDKPLHLRWLPTLAHGGS